MDKRILLIFLINIICVWSTPRFAYLVNKREVFCGSRLNEALSAVCQGNYNSLGRKAKKSIEDFVSNYNEYEENLGAGEEIEVNAVAADFPFVQKETAHALIPERMRRRGGVADECCHKACSYRHLSLYCAN